MVRKILDLKGIVTQKNNIITKNPYINSKIVLIATIMYPINKQDLIDNTIKIIEIIIKLSWLEIVKNGKIFKNIQ